MAEYFYKTNNEKLQCVNCGNTEFTRHMPEPGKDVSFVPYECERCHFVSWFPEVYAPGAEDAKT